MEVGDSEDSTNPYGRDVISTSGTFKDRVDGRQVSDLHRGIS